MSISFVYLFLFTFQNIFIFIIKFYLIILQQHQKMCMQNPYNFYYIYKKYYYYFNTKQLNRLGTYFYIFYTRNYDDNEIFIRVSLSFFFVEPKIANKIYPYNRRFIVWWWLLICIMYRNTVVKFNWNYLITVTEYIFSIVKSIIWQLIVFLYINCIFALIYWHLSIDIYQFTLSYLHL